MVLTRPGPATAPPRPHPSAALGGPLTGLPPCFLPLPQAGLMHWSQRRAYKSDVDPERPGGVLEA